MGKVKKGAKIVKRDYLERVGGFDNLVKKLHKADILKKNTQHSSKLWSQLASDFFEEDSKKVRMWIYNKWSENWRGLRDRVRETAGLDAHNGTMQSEDQELTTLNFSDILETNVELNSEDLSSQAKALMEEEEEESEEEESEEEEEGEVRKEEETSEEEEEEVEKEQVGEEHREEEVWRQCPEVNKIFFISMTRDLWEKIQPDRGSSQLKAPWTDYVYNSFKEKNPCCTLSFKYQHVKSPYSRKKNLPYIKMSAVCTFSTCPAKYSFTIKSIPSSLQEDIQILVQRAGDIRHKMSERKARHATKLKRGKIAKAVTQGPSNYFYTKLHSTPEKQLVAGNMSECLNKNVVRALCSEFRKKETLHSNVILEISLLQALFKETDSNYFKMPGYIQHCSMDPFSVHLYTERGISILVEHLRGKSPVSLYLDATGSVVAKIPEQPKCVLYYAMVLPGNGNAPPLPVCEMVCNDHTVPTIAFWLMQFKCQLSKYTNFHVHQIETDYSWALIQSALLAFNNEHISLYLERAFDFCMGKKSWEDMKSYTVMHICAAHILKAVKQQIARQTEDHGLRSFALFAFARLQNTTNMTEARTVFRPLCVLLTTPEITKLVKENQDLLESIISKSKDDTMEEIPESSVTEKSEIEDNALATTIIGRSPFYAYFKQIMQEVKEEAAAEETCGAREENTYFCPGILTALFDTYLGIFPLWSGVLLAELSRYHSQKQETDTAVKIKTRDTNCHIEGYFRIVKHSILQKKKKLRPGTFIRTMYQTMKARYVEHIICHKLPQKLLLQPVQPNSIEQSPEPWRKKDDERVAPSTSRYFSAPEIIPTPEKQPCLIPKTDPEILYADEVDFMSCFM